MAHENSELFQDNEARVFAILDMYSTEIVSQAMGDVFFPERSKLTEKKYKARMSAIKVMMGPDYYAAYDEIKNLKADGITLFPFSQYATFHAESISRNLEERENLIAREKHAEKILGLAFNRIPGLSKLEQEKILFYITTQETGTLLFKPIPKAEQEIPQNIQHLNGIPYLMRIEVILGKNSLFSEAAAHITSQIHKQVDHWHPIADYDLEVHQIK